MPSDVVSEIAAYLNFEVSLNTIELQLLDFETWYLPNNQSVKRMSAVCPAWRTALQPRLFNHAVIQINSQSSTQDAQTDRLVMWKILPYVYSLNIRIRISNAKFQRRGAAKLRILLQWLEMLRGLAQRFFNIQKVTITLHWTFPEGTTRADYRNIDPILLDGAVWHGIAIAARNMFVGLFQSPAWCIALKSDLPRHLKLMTSDMEGLLSACAILKPLTFQISQFRIQRSAQCAQGIEKVLQAASNDIKVEITSLESSCTMTKLTALRLSSLHMSWYEDRSRFFESLTNLTAPCLQRLHLMAPPATVQKTNFLLDFFSKLDAPRLERVVIQDLECPMVDKILQDIRFTAFLRGSSALARVDVIINGMPEQLTRASKTLLQIATLLKSLLVQFRIGLNIDIAAERREDPEGFGLSPRHIMPIDVNLHGLVNSLIYNIPAGLPSVTYFPPFNLPRLTKIELRLDDFVHPSLPICILTGLQHHHLAAIELNGISGSDFSTLYAISGTMPFYPESVVWQFFIRLNSGDAKEEDLERLKAGWRSAGLQTQVVTY